MRKSRWLAMLMIVLLLSGCTREPAEAGQTSTPPMEQTNQEINRTEQSEVPDYEAYLDSVKEQSAILETSLEQDVLSQVDMNEKAREIYELWDGAMTYFLSQLEIRLPEGEVTKLQDAQRVWMTEREKAMDAAGREFAGGSIYPLIVNSEAARVTEERVYELYKLLNPES